MNFLISFGICLTPTNIYRIQAYDSIMSGYFCIGFIDFMLKGKKFIRIYTFIFS